MITFLQNDTMNGCRPYVAFKISLTFDTIRILLIFMKKIIGKEIAAKMPTYKARQIFMA